jgi:hypothetical protein
MTNRVQLRIGDQRAEMTLFVNRAPKICGHLLGALPIKSSAILAKIAGLEIMVRTPFFVDTGPENAVQGQQAGNVGYWAFSQNVCIFCEDLPGLASVSLIGRISRNMEGIQEAARRCRIRQGATVEIFV